MIINVHGAIGVGKTTLCSNLRQFLLGVGFDEPQINNPVLGLFYKDQKKWSFVSQVSFFNDLTIVGMLSKDYNSLEKIDYVINDSSQLSNLVFTLLLKEQGKINEKEYDLLCRIANLSEGFHQKETINVVLHKKSDEILEQIKRRNRDFEVGFQEQEYFKVLSDRYVELFEKATKIIKPARVVYVDVSGLSEKETLQKVLNSIGLEKTVERVRNEN